MNTWNLAESNWGATSVSVPIEVGVTYHAAFVLEGNPDGDINTNDGSVTGFLNGVDIGSSTGAGHLRAHADGIGIGGNNGGNTIFADNSFGTGGNFHGTIDEVAQWNRALDSAEIAFQAAEYIPELGSSLLAGLGALLLFRRRRT